MEYRWAVEVSTGRFLYGGTAPYDCVPGLSKDQCRVVTGRAVDIVTEKWDGTAIVPATAQEISAWTPVLPPTPEQRFGVIEAALKKAGLL